MEAVSRRVLRSMECGWPLVPFPIHTQRQDGYLGSARVIEPDQSHEAEADSTHCGTNQFPRSGGEPRRKEDVHDWPATSRRTRQVRCSTKAVRSVSQWHIGRVS